MNPKIFLLSVVPVVLAACGAGDTTPPAGEAAVPPAPTFAVAPLAEVAIRPERGAPAAVVGKHEARLSAEVAATVLALPVDVGQTVARGAVVVRLDPRDAELALERAEAALAQAAARHAQARAQSERAVALRARNFYSQEALTLKETELAAAAADLRAATAQRATARRALDKHTLRAPFDAVVRTRHAQLGELAAPGAPLLTLVSAREVELAARLQPDEAQAFAAAVPPEPTFVAGGRVWPLQLLRVSPALDRASRSVEARFVFVAAPPAVGLEGRLVWRETAAWLPADLPVRRDGRLGVFLAQDGKAVFHPLPDAQEGRPARADLPADAALVTAGRQALADGMALK
jgi:RND family efflux transporter MFP subunit